MDDKNKHFVQNSYQSGYQKGFNDGYHQGQELLKQQILERMRDQKLIIKQLSSIKTQENFRFRREF
ncbi:MULTISPECIES: hypothetical protein [Bacillaceae]|uniref:hypothetical protein n=1 Tax=Bacillaceae TaxID=186817 RepID=UPI000BF76675|nr:MULTISPECIES: hypothetical protein [Bacillaceae]PFH92637.1 hypothetical protein COI44_00155 [Bacillus sp. AFS088145]